MRVAVFSTKPFDRSALTTANDGRHDITFLEERLTPRTALLAQDHDAVCLFANDDGSAASLEALHDVGVRFIALRSAGFNHVDIEAAARLGMTIARVPAYSPYAVAEHTMALILCLNRKLHRAHNRVREQNFALDGLLGFDLHGKTIGVIGTGRIGEAFCRIAVGFGMRVLASDPDPSDACAASGVEYVETDRLLREAHIISIHCPLTPATRHLLDANALARTRDDVLIVNTSRGAVLDTGAVIAALKASTIGGLALDVYEEEADLFFKDLSDTVIQDDVFARLLTFPNVLITAHQGFFTREALSNIAGTTIANITGFENGDALGQNAVTTDMLA